MGWMLRLRHYFLPHQTNNYRARLLHPLPMLWLVLGMVVFQFVVAGVGRGLPAVLGYAASIPPEEVVELTNKRRVEVGLASLRLNAELAQAALMKAADMFAKDYWAHVAPDGGEPWKFITDTGYVYVFAGENLARDFTSPEAVVAAWMESPTHKENLLSSRYEEIGVAVVDGELGGLPTTLVVEMFGTRVRGVGRAEAVATRGGGRVVAAGENRVTVSPAPVPTGVVAMRPAQYVAEEVGERVMLISEAKMDERPRVSPFAVTKTVAVVVVSGLLLVLILDLAVFGRMKLVRISGRSFAHVAFLGVILVAILVMKSGRII